MRRDIKLSALLLDTENPRLDVQAGHRDAIRALFQAEPKKMLRLLEDIVEFGSNPLERVGVSPGPDGSGRFVVHEGNRRVAAQLVLRNPELLKDILGSSIEARVRKLSAAYLKTNPLAEVECVELPADELRHWITLKHTGENQGAGVVPWGTLEQNRHLERMGRHKSLARQILDAFAKTANEQHASQLRSVPLTNLQRLLESKQARDRLGMDFGPEGGILLTHYPLEETWKWLRRVARDFSTKKVKVKDIYSTKNMLDYIGGFSKNELPDPKKKLDHPMSVESAEKAPARRGRKKESRTRPKKWSFKSISIVPRNERLQDIFDELKKFTFQDAPNVHGVMLRVFLELTVEDYLSRHRIVVAPDRNKTRANLERRTKGAADHAQGKGWIDEKLAQAAKRTASSDILHSQSGLNEFLHNHKIHPTPTDVEKIWKTLAPFFVQLHAN